MTKIQTIKQLLFPLFTALIFTIYTAAHFEPELPTLFLGCLSGLLLGIILIISERLIRSLQLKNLNTLALGLFFGYFLGQAALFCLTKLLLVTEVSLSSSVESALSLTLFMTTLYLAVNLVFRGTEQLEICLPFVKFQPIEQKKKDILIGASALADSRLIDFTAFGLLDNHLILPRFSLNEIYESLETGSEVQRNKAMRAIEGLKKLKAQENLNLRISEVDFPHHKEPLTKLAQLARQLKANILVTNLNRVQSTAAKDVQFIDLNDLANALKPITQTGEYIEMKIQRFGKEANQGVGYLEDGTMVVVNGGADYIGETIRSQVLSVKHTPSGRMIFCNVSDTTPPPTGNYSAPNSPSSTATPVRSTW